MAVIKAFLDAGEYGWVTGEKVDESPEWLTLRGRDDGITRRINKRHITFTEEIA